MQYLPSVKKSQPPAIKCFHFLAEAVTLATVHMRGSCLHLVQGLHYAVYVINSTCLQLYTWFQPKNRKYFIGRLLFR